jgi:hypothetical protein
MAVTTQFIPNPTGLARLFSPTGDLGIWMQGKVEQVEQVARANCPRNTGALAGSIEGRVVAGVNAGRGGATTVAMGRVTAGDESAPYAVYVHEGTRPHEITPRQSPVLAFPSRSSGMTVFTTRVNHPGTRADPFLWNALRASIV